jgi:hypothetical protein
LPTRGGRAPAIGSDHDHHDLVGAQRVRDRHRLGTEETA